MRGSDPRLLRRTYTAGRDDHRPSRGGERDCPHPRPPPHPRRGPRPRRSGDRGRTRPPVRPSHLLHLAPATAGLGSPPPTPPFPGEVRSPQPRRRRDVETPAVQRGCGGTGTGGGRGSPLPGRGLGDETRDWERPPSGVHPQNILEIGLHILGDFADWKSSDSVLLRIHRLRLKGDILPKRMFL
ncbi:uncharacterized protein RBU33_024024 [Hipposideros larvatus]